MMRRAQPWLGTLVEITIADDMAEADATACFAEAFAAIAQVHGLMSFHDPHSDVSRINRAQPGEGVEVHPQTAAVLRAALEMADASGGIFDISCGAQLVEWDFLPRPQGESPAPPPNGYASIYLEGNTARKTAPLWIDLGGIAKGHAVDMAVAALKRHGIRSACVNAGGDLRVLGETPYPVLIRDPIRPTQAAREIALSNSALATSATYFSRKRLEDEEYAPLIDGRTGRPVRDHLSASVLAPSCMTADALTKIVMITGDAQHPLLSRFDAAAFII